MGQGSAVCEYSPTVLQGVALVVLACRLMHPSCGPGNCPVLLMGAGTVDGSGQQSGTAGSPAGCLDMGTEFEVA